MRRPGGLIQKDAASDEPYGFDWTAWLTELGVGVTIATSTWTTTAIETPALLTTHNPSIVAGSLKTQAYFSGGTRGQRYTVTNRITTNSAPPVTDERSIVVLVSNR